MGVSNSKGVAIVVHEERRKCQQVNFAYVTTVTRCITTTLDYTSAPMALLLAQVKNIDHETLVASENSLYKQVIDELAQLQSFFIHLGFIDCIE